MKLGIYFDLRNPPGSDRAFSGLYGYVLEMCTELRPLLDGDSPTLSHSKEQQ